jgi:hypothetical protein
MSPRGEERVGDHFDGVLFGQPTSGIGQYLGLISAIELDEMIFLVGRVRLVHSPPNFVPRNNHLSVALGTAQPDWLHPIVSHRWPALKRA